MSDLEVSLEMVEALQKLSHLLETDDALQETLDTVVQLSVKLLPGCEFAGVTMRRDGRDLTAAASDDYALEIDHIQYDVGEGPCVSALETNTFIKIESVDEETRWPDFVSRAADRGFRSSLSFPLKENGSTGALNLYATKDRAFDETSQRVGEIFSRQVTIALRNAHTYSAAQRLADQLNEALESRDVIGQAKGILMEREGISGTDAFEMLKTISQKANVKLREIAQQVVNERKIRDG